MLSILFLVIVFILISIRQVGNFRLKMWQIMLFGAVGVLATRQISLLNAAQAINLDVILFLFGMFITGQAFEESGFLSYLSNRLFQRANTLNGLLFFILFGIGFLAAFLMNDTLAIIGTPVVLLLAKNNNLPPKILLLALSFAVTIGTVVSPIGNPQNLLIAIDGNVHNPFVTFLEFLFLPTVINLFLAYLLMRALYQKHFDGRRLTHPEVIIKDRRLARLSAISLGLLVLLILGKIVTVFFGSPFDFKLTYIALAAALPVILFSGKRFKIVRCIDWGTLVFFAAMFVLMESVWDSGFFQSIIFSLHLDLTSINVILGVSVILSQFISNVPLVALYLPELVRLGASTTQMMALAAGSTIAGNLSILGAASNIIVIQNAEKQTGETVTFLEFVKVGVPLTIVNVLVYWVFLSVI